jgi:hypothetical protein
MIYIYFNFLPFVYLHEKEFNNASYAICYDIKLFIILCVFYRLTELQVPKGGGNVSYFILIIIIIYKLILYTFYIEYYNI